MTDRPDSAPDEIPDGLRPEGIDGEEVPTAEPEVDLELTTDLERTGDSATDLDEVLAREEIEQDLDDELADGVLTEEGAPAEPQPAVVPVPPPVGRPGRGTPPVGTAPVPERAIRVNDRVSKIFVLVSIAAFVAILLNGLLFGVGGALRPYVPPTPEPIPSVAPSVAPSASPSGSPSPSASLSGSVAPSGSVVPSASPSPSPS